MITRKNFVKATVLVFITLNTGCATIKSGLSGTNLQENKNQIINVYDEALNKFNRGAERWNVGVAHFQESQYGSAIKELASATDQFSQAKEGFRSASDQAETIGQNDVAAICEESARRAKLMSDAAAAALDASELAKDNASTGEINKRIRKAQEFEDQASQLQVINTQELSNMLAGN